MYKAGVTLDVAKNIGKLDRLARLIIGILAMAVGSYFAITMNFWIGMIIAFIGLFSVYEAVVGWCVLYAWLGKNTCPVHER